MGCEIVEAADGLQAMRIVQSQRHFDLMVTDVGLPGMNGRQLADAARQANPVLPVLLVTGYAGQALNNVRLADGIEIMRKPFPLEELAARVKALLARKALRRHGLMRRSSRPLAADRANPLVTAKRTANSAMLTPDCQKLRIISGACAQIPYAVEQRIFSRIQGNFSAELGMNSEVRSELWISPPTARGEGSG